MGRRAFTVEEANALVPQMESVLARIRELRSGVEESAERIQLLDALWGVKLREPGTPDHEEFLRHRERVRSLVEETERLIREEIGERGVRFPTGGLEHGLLDFPTTYRGRWVYLCWMSGEPEVRRWHEVDAGFQGRREVTEEQRRIMGRFDDPGELDDSLLDF